MQRSLLIPVSSFGLHTLSSWNQSRTVPRRRSPSLVLQWEARKNGKSFLKTDSGLHVHSPHAGHCVHGGPASPPEKPNCCVLVLVGRLPRHHKARSRRGNSVVSGVDDLCTEFAHLDNHPSSRIDFHYPIRKCDYPIDYPFLTIFDG